MPVYTICLILSMIYELDSKKYYSVFGQKIVCTQTLNTTLTRLAAPKDKKAGRGRPESGPNPGRLGYPRVRVRALLPPDMYVPTQLWVLGKPASAMIKWVSGPKPIPPQKNMYTKLLTAK